MLLVALKPFGCAGSNPAPAALLSDGVGLGPVLGLLALDLPVFCMDRSVRLSCQEQGIAARATHVMPFRRGLDTPLPCGKACLPHLPSAHADGCWAVAVPICRQAAVHSVRCCSIWLPAAFMRQACFALAWGCMV